MNVSLAGVITKKGNSRPLIIHPYFFAIYPILALLAYNIDENPINVAFRSIVMSAIGTLIFWSLFSRLSGGRAKGALLATFLLIIFFAYGHIHSFIELPISVLGTNLRSHRYMVPFFIVIFALAWWVVNKKTKSVLEINRVLNFVGLFLLLYPSTQIGHHYLVMFSQSIEIRLDKPMTGSEEAGISRPDIYYIVLDMYARGDLIHEKMGFDNSPFLNQLRDHGFFVAECALSNYSTTKLSLMSTLNMDYLDAFLPGLSPTSNDESILDPLLLHNRVRSFFDSQGYSIVAFQNDFYGTEWRDADYFFEVENSLMDRQGLSELLSQGNQDYLNITSGESLLSKLIFGLNLNKFEWLLLQTTAARIIPDYIARTTSGIEVSADYLESIRQYFLVRQILEIARSAVEIQGPKFFYLHVVSPHPPFVFSADGAFDPMRSEQTYATNDWYRDYTEQIQYLNSRVLSLVSLILASSDGEPIIIIQGDHGTPRFEMNEAGSYYQYNEILSAYLLPGDGEGFLYPNISPVNSWRIVLRDYFGVDLELLEDLSYSYDWAVSPFKHELYREQSQACK